jgi:hypothetical protein
LRYEPKLFVGQGKDGHRKLGEPVGRRMIKSGRATTIQELLADREEVCCPDCRKPLVVSALPDGKRRFDACGRDCREVYDIPGDCILLGPEGGLMFIYQPRRRPDDPKPLSRFIYTNGGWD